MPKDEEEKVVEKRGDVREPASEHDEDRTTGRRQRQGERARSVTPRDGEAGRTNTTRGCASS